MSVRARRWLTIGLVLAGCGGLPQVFPQAEVIVSLKNDQPWIPGVGSVVERHVLNSPFVVVRLPKGTAVEAAIAQLKADPSVREVVPNRTLPIVKVPNDPMYSIQWALERIEVQPCWERKIDTSQIAIAILDTGIDDNHPDLKGRVVRGYNFTDQSTNTMDTQGHGTHVAGIIGALGNNSVGVSGVLPNAKIMAVKVLNQSGGSDAWAIAGIKYAVDNGAKVINMSFNSNETRVNPLYVEAVNYARSRGVLMVAAAGNNGGEVTYPANTPGCIAVSATAYSRRLEWIAPFSNRGDSIALSAPGAGIMSTVAGGGYEVYSGTSMAAPYVTAAVAMLMAMHPDWSLDQIENRLHSAVVDLGVTGKDPQYGYGRLRLSQLLE